MSTGGTRRLADLVGQELEWSQPATTRRAYELRAADEVVATLRFERGTLAYGEAEGGQWSVKREGFWHPQVTVRVPGSDSNIASFRAHMGGSGDLVFSDGRSFRLASTNALHTEWVWQQDDQVLVRFQGRHGVIKANGTVEVEPQAAGLAELALLAVLGWYLILLHAQDTAAAATGAIVASRVAVVR